jgi:integrase/recombinase XerD
MESILFQSKYYKIWYNHVPLTSKEHVIRELRKFDKFLVREDYKGELDFDQFHGSLRNVGVYRPIQESFIDKFVEYLSNDCKASKGVLYNVISSLKNFFRFLYEIDLIQHNPMEDYPNPYYDRPIKNTALSKEECIALLRAAIDKDPFFRQEFVLIWLMLVTGLRNSEVRYLTRQKVNFENNIINIDVKQKTNARSVGITDALLVEINRYINHTSYDAWKEQGNDYLFFCKNKQITIKKLSDIVKDLSERAKLSRKVTPHDLRRTAGYLMQSSGMHIMEIQRQLGHELTATTLRYTPSLGNLARLLSETVS